MRVADELMTAREEYRDWHVQLLTYWSACVNPTGVDVRCDKLMTATQIEFTHVRSPRHTWRAGIKAGSGCNDCLRQEDKEMLMLPIHLFRCTLNKTRVDLPNGL